ncbi:MAG: phosphatidate cytidylyltransferase [Spirochaetia bacterium]|jgi:phosphatidate cytidylyltransferase|nr:phosphatidate cytidylyltransferase [Spirochaetia bacterium]
MSNLKLRVLLIFTVLPLLFTLVFLLPHFNYLAISIVAAAFSISGTYETWKLFYGKYNKTDFFFVTVIAYSIPLLVYLESASIIPINTVSFFSGIIIFLIFSYQIFNRDESTFSEINKKTSSMLILMFYPGLFFSYTIRFTTLHYPSYALLVFMLVVFVNDICAYVTGMLWGGKSRKVILISPKKSLIGFIGGFTSSIITATVFYLIFPPFFANNYFYSFATGALIGIISIVGDLNESAMKRSAKIKDSGDVLPGRGGILDNIDSLIFSAPVFYYIIKYISSQV